MKTNNFNQEYMYNRIKYNLKGCSNIDSICKSKSTDSIYINFLNSFKTIRLSDHDTSEKTNLIKTDNYIEAIVVARRINENGQFKTNPYSKDNYARFVELMKSVCKKHKLAGEELIDKTLELHNF